MNSLGNETQEWFWFGLCVIAMLVVLGVLTYNVTRTTTPQESVIVVTDYIVGATDTTQIVGRGSMYYAQISENDVVKYYKKINETDSTPITISSKGVIFHEFTGNDVSRVEFEQTKIKVTARILFIFPYEEIMLDTSRFSKITVICPKGTIRRSLNFDLEK